ncbi:hypothetical protein [Candidatus Nitrososphaera gargensis]|nr:hypothetical protein [Candidatus Nitrososphaera gargensis]
MQVLTPRARYALEKEQKKNVINRFYAKNVVLSSFLQKMPKSINN